MTAEAAGSGDQQDPERDPSSQTTAGNSPGKRTNWFLFRLIAMAIGFLMLAGAVVLVWTQHDRVATALQAISHPSATLVLLLVLSMLASLVVTGIQFQLLLARHGIPALEMQGLIAGSALLNFLPLKAGLLGRIAYHQVVHGIHPMETAKAMILARGGGVLAIALTAFAVLFRDLMEGPLWAWALVPAAIPGWFIMLRATRTAGLVVVLKYIDLLLMAARYQLAFTMMDETVGFDVCMAMAAIGMLAGAVPFLTGGIGLREWLVGWLASMLVTLPAALELGLLADLVNRATELVVLLPVGGLAILWLRPRLRRSLASVPTARVISPDQSPGPEP